MLPLLFNNAWKQKVGYCGQRESKYVRKFCNEICYSYANLKNKQNIKVAIEMGLEIEHLRR